jgi:hypothetical protein
MISPDTPLRTAAVARLTSGAGSAALVAAGITSPANGGVTTAPDEPAPALPYVEVQGTTMVEGGRSDCTRSLFTTLTLSARGATLPQAEAIAAVLVSQLATRYEVTGFEMAHAVLDLYGPPFREPPPGSRPWSLPVRFRYTLHQSAAAGE